MRTLPSRFAPAAMAALFLAMLLAAPALPGEEEANNGQDITRPLTRFDIRYEYQNNPGSRNDDMHVVTLRVDKPFELGEKWKLATRFDLPLAVTNQISRDNPDGANHFGLSDVLVQALLVNTPTERFAWAAGAQVVFPTATEDEMGTGNWRIVPTIGMRWSTNEVMKGSWVALAARWDRSFASTRNDAAEVNNLQFAPLINIPLPHQWFINLFPSTDIKYNLGKRRPIDEGRWFVPADVLVGKMIRKNVVATWEGSVPIVNDYKVYDFKTEFRIGILF